MSYDTQLKVWFAGMLALALGSLVYSWIYYNKRDREEAKKREDLKRTT